MVKERIDYIDRLRGVNILLVVMGHVIIHNVVNGQNVEILIWGSTFRMPLFMFLCGYIASKLIKPKIFDNYSSFVLKKCRTLLIPFFAWPLLVDNFFFSSTASYNLIEKFFELINGGGLWFLYFLFYISLIYSVWLYLSNKLNNNKNLVIDLGLVVLLLAILGVIRYTGLVFISTQFFLFFIFYFMGVFVAKYKTLQKLMMNVWFFSFMLLLFFVLVGHYQYGYSSVENSVIKIACALSGIVVFYFLLRKVSFSEKIDKYIRNWGMNSLAIYVTHFYVVAVFNKPFISAEFNQIPLFIITSGLTIISIFISIFIFKILRMSNVLNLLLYGRWK